MTVAERRLAALAACLAGARAGALLDRGASAEARSEAARLAALPREGRLHALAAALAAGVAADLGARSAEVARAERPGIAALVSRLALGLAPGPRVAPALARIVQERLSR